ncbi:Hsp20/alpha crystallin family protein [Corynebacterium sp. S7]|uniref:Hsp20/alpha crystallin family protein n=1 Tax=Corynebacterium sp. SCR221107 TaxID=3017361 RepID=UPI0022EC7006|nr:Hsp20/alpha crystallin family protein [Corynebacterium sp. SCR221107]WBT08484.1 Hsp20/alpha crystallin family protein [Corynebacterium sp. SCR221107]
MPMMRIDPFRELDRLSQELLRGTLARPVALTMDAWKDDETFVLEFDIPGVDSDSIDLDIERNVLTVTAERQSRTREDVEVIAEERATGKFRRQVMLSDNLDPDAAQAQYTNGVLTVRIPVAEKAKPRKIEISSSPDQKEISA